jgi:hypothetical protein
MAPKRLYNKFAGLIPGAFYSVFREGPVVNGFGAKSVSKPVQKGGRGWGGRAKPFTFLHGLERRSGLFVAGLWPVLTIVFRLGGAPIEKPLWFKSCIKDCLAGIKYCFSPWGSRPPDPPGWGAAAPKPRAGVLGGGSPPTRGVEGAGAPQGERQYHAFFRGQWPGTYFDPSKQRFPAPAEGLVSAGRARPCMP